MRSLNEDIKLLTLKLCVINLDAFRGGFSKKDCEFELEKHLAFSLFYSLFLFWVLLLSKHKAIPYKKTLA